jgi:hypothetical protein
MDLPQFNPDAARRLARHPLAGEITYTVGNTWNPGEQGVFIELLNSGVDVLKAFKSAPGEFKRRQEAYYGSSSGAF